LALIRVPSLGVLFFKPGLVVAPLVMNIMPSQLGRRRQCGGRPIAVRCCREPVSAGNMVVALFCRFLHPFCSTAATEGY
jgi:hypothetical protein